MALVTLEEAKEYLRVDSGDEDATIGILLATACRICVDVARLSDKEWNEINEGTDDSEKTPVQETMKVAILYAVGYLFEHREEADHHALTLTLRSVLFAVREGVV